MSGVSTREILGIYADGVKAHIPCSAGHHADVPKATPPNDARRPLSESDKIVIRNIARLYRQHGIISGNQSSLAREAGVDQTFISKLLKYRTSISVTSLHAIAQALGVPSWALLVPGDWELGNPPVLQPLTQIEKELYAKIREASMLVAGIAKGK